MSIPFASAEAYLTLPVVLDNPAWMRVIYLENPARVADMNQRLATVVQAAWQELRQQPQATTLSFGVFTKHHSGCARDWVSLVLRVLTPRGEPPYLQIQLQTIVESA